MLSLEERCIDSRGWMVEFDFWFIEWLVIDLP